MEELQIGFIPKWICLLYWGVYTLVFLFFLFQLQDKKRKYMDSSVYAIFAAIVLIAFCLFYCLDTDFFNYMYVATTPDQYEGLGTVEGFYLWLARILEGDYLLFRLCIWGTAVIMVITACYFYDVSKYNTLIFVLLIFFNLFCYGRIILAMAVFWASLAFSVKVRTLPMKVLGILLILMSFFLHRSSAIAIASLAILAIPFNLRNEIMIMIGIIIFGGVLAYLFLSGEMLSASSDIAGRVNSYNQRIEEGEWGGLNIIGFLFRIAQYFLFYLIFLIIRNKMYKLKMVPRVINSLYKVTWVLIVSSTAFLIALGFTPYFYRVINMTLIPLCILLAYLFCIKSISKHQIVLILGISLMLHYLRFYSTYTHCV